MFATLAFFISLSTRVSNSTTSNDLLGRHNRFMGIHSNKDHCREKVSISACRAVMENYFAERGYKQPHKHKKRNGSAADEHTSGRCIVIGELRNHTCGCNTTNLKVSILHSLVKQIQACMYSTKSSFAKCQIYWNIGNVWKPCRTIYS